MGNREVDQEWVELVKQALDAGISKKEIREFLQTESQELNTEYKAI
ncbi:anti-repressor SinI family protein [Rossellomorea aquimaris]|nr:anti-repressor SinI family protein [Rossellomorea aquimaris]